MTKKIPHALDTEELLKVISQNKETTPQDNETAPEILEYTNDILPFLSTFNILPGEQRIKKGLLFSIYKAWSKQPVKRKDFLNELYKYLEIGYQPDGCFYINHNAMKLTYDVYRKYQKEYRKTHSKHWTKHFENFLKYYSLTDKGYWVELPILYFLYDKYLFELGIQHGPRKTLYKDQFEKFCRLYFKEKTTEFTRLYSVSSNITNFFQAGQLERMRKEYVKQFKTDKKKKNKKKRSKISRSRPKVQPKN